MLSNFLKWLCRPLKKLSYFVSMSSSRKSLFSAVLSNDSFSVRHGAISVDRTKFIKLVKAKEQKAKDKATK